MSSEERDPHNTIENLSLALEFMATSDADARERFKAARSHVWKLEPEDFPEPEDRELFVRIVETDPDSVDEKKLVECLRWVWELHWRMSGNTLYS